MGTRRLSVLVIGPPDSPVHTGGFGGPPRTLDKLEISLQLRDIVRDAGSACDAGDIPAAQAALTLGWGDIEELASQPLQKNGVLRMHSLQAACLRAGLDSQCGELTPELGQRAIVVLKELYEKWQSYHNHDEHRKNNHQWLALLTINRGLVHAAIGDEDMAQASLALANTISVTAGAAPLRILGVLLRKVRQRPSSNPMDDFSSVAQLYRYVMLQPRVFSPSQQLFADAVFTHFGRYIPEFCIAAADLGPSFMRPGIPDPPEAFWERKMDAIEPLQNQPVDFGPYPLLLWRPLNTF